MTSNQLILLLQFFRGTAKDELKMGTYDYDFLHLLSRGLIDKNGEVTAIGEQRIKSILYLI